MSDLTNDQIRVKVAEFCGYTRVTELTRRAQWVKDGIHYQVYCNGHEMNAGITFLPNYPLSLDACADGFERTLNDVEFSFYVDKLHILRSEFKEHPVIATARHRCLAFIAVKEGK